MYRVMFIYEQGCAILITFLVTCTSFHVDCILISFLQLPSVVCLLVIDLLEVFTY